MFTNLIKKIEKQSEQIDKKLEKSVEKILKISGINQLQYSLQIYCHFQIPFL